MRVVRGNRDWRLWPAIMAVATLLCALLLTSAIAAGRDQNSRPRNVQSTSPKPAPTTVPVPSPQTTPVRPAASPTPTPTPTAKPVDRIAPTLGEPPPPPKLKPTPTPTPPEFIEPDSTITIDTDLVNLHVRVIDRNNRPIDNVSQNEFKVYEDGVVQPIHSFTREEVPISYGLAVDTSGSLRTQLTSVIDAGKTIINSNKPGDETFLVRFISSDKIETVQDFTANKDALIDGIDGFYVEGGQTAVIDAV